LVEQQEARDQYTFVLDAGDSVFSAILPGQSIRALDGLCSPLRKSRAAGRTTERTFRPEP
jgi:Xaa-Pro aminopeptidase